MARGPYDPYGEQDENDPARPRIPKPAQVVAGTPGDPAGQESHGTNTWDTTGHDQPPVAPKDPFAYKDYYEGMEPPQLIDVQQRPRVSVPQIGRAGSVLGAVTGGISGFQELRQKDWDVKREAPLGDYNRRMELAKNRAAEQHGHEMATRLSGQGIAPIVGRENGVEGVYLYNPQTRQHDQFIPGGSTAGMGAANVRGAWNEKVAEGNRASREKVAGMTGSWHIIVAEKTGASRERAAAAGAESRRLGHPVYYEDEDTGVLYQINPDSTASVVKGAPTGLTKPTTPTKPDVVTSTTEQHDPGTGALESRKTKKHTVVPPKAQAAADPLEGRTATGANGQKIIKRGGKWVDVQTGQPVQQ